VDRRRPRAEAEALGYTVVDGESVIVTHLTETIRAHAAELLTRQDVRALLDRLKETNAAVVDEVVPDGAVARRDPARAAVAARRGRAIRDLGTIVEAVGDKARVTRDPSLLAEYARQALGRAITAPHLDSCALRAITLDPAIEQEVATSITQTDRRRVPRHGPAAPQAVVGALRARSSRPPRAARARCCCARRASAATCAGSSRRRAPPRGLLLQRDRTRHQR
jgi:flagellar biosynthesis protein FlhA